MSYPKNGIVYSVEAFVQGIIPIVGRASASSGGRLLWHHYNEREDGSYAWDHFKTVGTGWNGLKQVFDGRGGIIYFVEPVIEATVHLNRAGNTPASGGRLMWARHLGREDGTFRWDGPRAVGAGWSDFKQVFSSGDGIIYAIQSTVEGIRLDRPGTVILSGGKLIWYRHIGYQDGTFRWKEAREIATGWGNFKHVFAGDNGVIYAVKPNGDLMWYRHTGREDGTANLSKPQRVGSGWGAFEHLFYAGNGVIYGVEPFKEGTVPEVGRATPSSGGRLIWYRHLGMADGTFHWEGPKTVDTGWSGLERVFANGDHRVNGVAIRSGVRFCEFKDPSGSPTLGPRSYGIKGNTNVPRRMPLTWSLTGAVSGMALGLPPITPTFTAPPTMWSIITQAFGTWSQPSAAPELNIQYVLSGGDIVFGVQNLGGFDSAGNIRTGLTSDDGSTIDFSINPAVTFVPRIPPGGGAGLTSLLSVATHEIGHALGLLHNTNTASIMTPVIPAGGPLEALGADDVQSIRALYGWAPQRAVEGIGTDSSPVICACGRWIVLAWKGIDPDDSVWVSRSADGVSWTPQRAVPGTGTTDGPALAWDGNTLWLALRGIQGDDGLYWATSSDFGDNWSGVSAIGGTGSANGPALTIYNGSPLLVWRGVPGDTGLYASFWSNGWKGQSSIGGTGSTDRPSICVDFNGLPRLVWRGIEGDDALYTTVFTGSITVPIWQPQEILQWIVVGNGGLGTVEIGVPASLRGPSVTTIVRNTPAGVLIDQEVLLVWRGVDGDQGIYFTQAAPGPPNALPVEWSTQAQIAGVGTSDRPSIAVFNGRIAIAWKGAGDDQTIWTSFN